LLRAAYIRTANRDDATTARLDRLNDHFLQLRIRSDVAAAAEPVDEKAARPTPDVT
jgi:hypothetical protein